MSSSITLIIETITETFVNVMTISKDTLISFLGIVTSCDERRLGVNEVLY